MHAVDIELARHGANVVLAVRNTAAGEDAARMIRSDAPESEITVRAVDLASLASVQDFATRIAGEHERIDLLVNNAGGERLGPRRTALDGFEFHLGTNILGHFASPGTCCRPSHAGGNRASSPSAPLPISAHLNFEDLQLEHKYSATGAYGASKLAVTMFGIELGRLRAVGSPVISVLAHPGLSRTNFTAHAWEERGIFGRAAGQIFHLVATQPAEQGALPQMYAATVPTVLGGEFFGPDGRGERRGGVTVVHPSREAAGRQLWSIAETLTGVSYL
jgi:NAD(P)-dependent dehydrogenase (short-subunit alcohol dehydrogenase family)